MKFTKILSLLLAVLMIAALFAGCAGETKPTEAQTEKQTEAQTEVDTDPQSETDTQAEPAAPVQEVDSCDPDSDWHQTTHTYDGFTVTVNKDGVAVGISVVDGDYALNGTVKIGSTPDDVKAAFGTPDTDEEWGIYYYGTMPMLNFYLDEETGLISGFGVMSEFVM